MPMDCVAAPLAGGPVDLAATPAVARGHQVRAAGVPGGVVGDAEPPLTTASRLEVTPRDVGVRHEGGTKPG